MTDEEKAEEYANNIISIAPKMYDGHKKIIMKESYLDGLAEGRKETEKENEQLKQQIENYQLAENESKEIIAELKQKYDELNDFSNSQCKRLLKMVRKMQSCNNCKYADLLFRDYPCRECLHNRFCTSKESKWEIIE